MLFISIMFLIKAAGCTSWALLRSPLAGLILEEKREILEQPSYSMYCLNIFIHKCIFADLFTNAAYPTLIRATRFC